MSQKYDAFISYRHKELDSFVAEKLHKLLEHYHIPGKIQKKTGKKKISRIFRDRDELPTSSNLADNIKEALLNSEYLIVICSRDTIESKWVQQEIALFLETHSRDKILAVLVSGEPEESFPEALRFAEETVIRADGTTEVVKVMREPLAADVRGNSNKEVYKKLKTEVLRVLAAILSCAYDDLRQRHRQYVMYRVIAVFSLCLCAALAFTGYAFHQSAKIKEQYNQALINESQYLAEVSGQLLLEGDREGALENALLALPGAYGVEDRPLVPEAVSALNSALYVYTHDGRLRFYPDRTYETDSQIDDVVGFSEDDQYFTQIDSSEWIYVYECESGNLYWKFRISDYAELLSNRIELSGNVSEHELLIGTDHEILFFDLQTKELIRYYNVDFEDGLSLSAINISEHYLAAATSSAFLILDLETEEILYQISMEEIEYTEWIDCLAFSPDEKTLAIGLDGWYPEEKGLLLFSLETGAFSEVETEKISDLIFLDNSQLLILEYTQNESMGNDRECIVRLYNMETGETVWKLDGYDSHSEVFSIDMFLMDMKVDDEEKEILGFVLNEMLLLADAHTGEIYVKAHYDGDIAGIGQYDSRRLLVGTNDGDVQIQALYTNLVPNSALNISGKIYGLYYNQTYQMVIQTVSNGNKSYVSTLQEDKNMKKMELNGTAEAIEFYTLSGTEEKTYRMIYMMDEDEMITEIIIENVRKQEERYVLKVYLSQWNPISFHMYEVDGHTYFSYSGDELAEESPDMALFTIDLTTGEEIHHIYQDEMEEEHRTYGRYVHSHHSDLCLFEGFSSFCIVKPSTGECVSHLVEYPGDYYIADIRFSDNDKYVLFETKSYETEEEKAELLVWDIEARAWSDVDFSQYNWEGVEIDRIPFAAVENWMAVYRDGEIQIISLETGELMDSIPFYCENYQLISFLDEDKYLLLYGDTQKITLYNLEVGSVVYELEQDLTMSTMLSLDPDLNYITLDEGSGYTEYGVVSAQLHIYTVDLENEKLYHYADISNGWMCFETEEVGVLDLNGDIYDTPLRSVEELQEQAMSILGW